MKFYRNYSDVIATIERSAGNDSIGDVWTETKSFSKETSIGIIINWAEKRGCSGRLIITANEAENQIIHIEDHEGK